MGKSPWKFSKVSNVDKRHSRTSVMSFNVANNPVTQKLYGEQALHREQTQFEEAPFFIIHPHSTFRIIWDIVTVVFLLANAVMIPFNIAFNSEVPVIGTQRLFLISDIWFMVDIMINLRTGIVSEWGLALESVVTDANEIRRQYVRLGGWFLIDFVSSVPWDLIVKLFISKSTSTNLNFMKILRMAKLLKLLRLTRLSKMLKKWEDYLDFQYNFTVNDNLFSMMGMWFLLLYVIHFNACILFLVPSLTGFPGTGNNSLGMNGEANIWGPTWVNLRNLTKADPTEQYAWALFKAASHMLVIGYGQAPPQCYSDMWTTVWSMIWGAVTFGVFVSQVISLIQSINSSSNAYKEKQTQVKEYMDFCKVPRELRNRIREYYEVKYHRKMFDEAAILDELNPLLREKVVNYNCRALVKSVEFLATADADFVSDLISTLKEEVYLLGDKIIEEGHIGSQMYFIKQGSVSVTTQSQMRPRMLSEGEHFGEICLFVSNLKRTATVIATTNVYVYTLAANDFNETLRWYPSEKVEMQRVAIERMGVLLNSFKQQRQSTMRRKTMRRKTIKEDINAIDGEVYRELQEQRDALIAMQQKTEDEIKHKSSNHSVRSNK